MCGPGQRRRRSASLIHEAGCAVLAAWFDVTHRWASRCGYPARGCARRQRGDDVGDKSPKNTQKIKSNKNDKKTAKAGAPSAQVSGKK